MALPSLLQLPEEILLQIAYELDNGSIKQWRLSCRSLLSSGTAAINFGRIYISPAKKNIEVFNNIVNHAVFRFKVAEVVYDDARLIHYHESNDSEDEDGLTIYDREYFESDLDASWLSFSFGALGNEALFNPMDWYLPWFDKIHPEKPRDPYNVAESKGLYHKLYEEQQIIIQNDGTLRTLRRAFPLLPNLRTVTLTTETYEPDYTVSRFQTPLIRSFPRGFRMPPPPPWERIHDWMTDPPIWDTLQWDQVRAKWHGYCVVMAAMAEVARTPAAPNLDTLIIDTIYGQGGVMHAFFSGPSLDYNNTKAAFANLRRLDLALSTITARDPATESDWACFRSGLLRDALASATRLQHLRFMASGEESKFEEIDFVPWLDILPLGSWPQLQTLVVGHLVAESTDVLSFLKLLPSTVRHVELRCLDFFEEEEAVNWEDFLEANKSDLARVFHTAPGRSLRIVVNDYIYGRRVAAENAITEFLAGWSENPFEGSDVRPLFGFEFSVKDESVTHLHRSGDDPLFKYSLFNKGRGIRVG